jgi:hypothetical protein
MIETPAAFRARTGRDYAPPPWLVALGPTLAPDEPCPTLFRYPGPCGLAELFGDRLMWLGPPGSDAVWMSAATAHTDGRGAALFGTLAILDPLALDPVRADDVFVTLPLFGDRRGVFAGTNRPVVDPDALVWVPPSKLAAALPWDEWSTPSAANAAFGPGLSDERARVGEELGNYLEELSALRATGAPGPRIPWCEVPLDDRRRRLADLGVHARWTPSAGG